MRQNVAEILQNAQNLPTLPGIALKILNAVRKKETNLREIGDILSTDPPLSAEVLKMINSPVYGLSKKITSVPHAVNLLGANAVKNLALSFTLVKNNQKGAAASAFDYTQFWKSSLVAAIIAKYMLQTTRPELAEDAFFLGLLHNIGILSLNQAMPKQYSVVLDETAEYDCGLQQVEKRTLGFDHTEIGEALIAQWGLPNYFSIPIGRHHQTEESSYPDVTVDLMTRALKVTALFVDLFHHSNKALFLDLIEKEMRRHGFNTHTDIEDIAAQVQRQTRHIFPLFEIKPGAEDPYDQIVETARKELISLSRNMLQQMVEQNRQIEALREKAAHDGLTNLLNFHSFHEVLKIEIARCTRYELPLCVLLGDVDFFKKVNDTYGHLAGDLVLQSVAAELKKELRTSDRIARYGGEEFAVILPQTTRDTAMKVAERLRRNIERLVVDYENRRIQVTMSFGVAAVESTDVADRTDLIRKSDRALYRAKTEGRNRCVLYTVP